MYRSEYLYQNIDKLVADSEVFPICVPSYNRPNAAILKFAKTVPLWVFVREEQYDEYHAHNPDIHKLVKISGVYDLGTTRAAIVDYMWKQGYNNIFQLDDDVNITSFMLPGVTAGGKEVMKPYCDGRQGMRGVLFFVFKLWVWMLRHSDPRVAVSAMGRRGDYWQPKYNLADSIYNMGACSAAVHLNLQLLMENNIQYASNSIEGAEDYALQYKVMREGLFSIVYRELVCDMAGGMGNNKGGCAVDNRIQKCQQYVDSFFNNLVEPEDREKFGIKTTRVGFPSVQFKWKKWKREDISFRYDASTVDADLKGV